MSALRKGSSTVYYKHTPQVFERRRSLFPTDIMDSEEDSDLGHISPLSFDSNSDDNLKNIVTHQDFGNGCLVSKGDSIGDYDIIGVVDSEQGPVCTPLNDKTQACSEAMSPLYLSPYCDRLQKLSENTIVNETPLKYSPSCKLKTPHDTSNTNSKVPKLVRKSLLDALENSSNKRKLTPPHSPEQCKFIKLDSKSSKVRTTLFPEIDMSLPTKSFYPKTELKMDKPSTSNRFPKSAPIFNVSRKAKIRRRFGQINAGVGHKIRKPKANKVRTLLAKATKINNSVITDYIQDLKELRATSTLKLIENKENANPKPPEQPLAASPKLIETTIVNGGKENNGNNKKRPLSPVLEPDPSKKFFKLSRSRGVVTVNKNIRVQVDSGKMVLLDKEAKETKSVKEVDFDSSDLNVDEPFSEESTINSILTSLSNEIDDGATQEDNNKIVLQAHNSVFASENSILLHNEPAKCAADVLLSPISQMCDVTSGLALNSPKRGRNLISVLNDMPNATSPDNVFNKSTADVEQRKVFPIFNGGVAIPERLSKPPTRNVKKFRSLSSSQMLLDAGQKKFGFTQCSECSFFYHIGDPSDEIIHQNYHGAGHILRFAGWKNERVVADLQQNGRIIQIIPGDSKIWWKKAKDLMEMINRELGCYDMDFNIDNSQVYLYIRSKMVVGCAVAIQKSQGHRMLTTKENEADLCSETIYPIKCGIPRIWVSHNYRNQRIGTKLMNVVKRNFMFGYVLDDADIALSAPTDMGKNFAKSYFKTENYLIYYV